MPPKRKSSANLDDSDAEGPRQDTSVHEGESTAPKKRGRKSMIDAILQEEARGTPPPTLPQNQWSVSPAQPPQNLQHATNPTKRRKIQPTTPSPLKQKYPSPGKPSIWGTNKGDFYSAFKSLTESFGGICFANLGTFPVLAWLIEGPRWPEDKVDGESLRLSLVTEFRPNDQPNTSIPAASLEKKKGGQKRRTKRGDLNAALGNAASTVVPNGTHTGIDPLPEGPQSAPQHRWPRFVRSPIYNPKLLTFCECLQPHCSYHCPSARSILSRGCTTYSWPAHEAMSYSDWSPPAPALPSLLPPDAVKVHAQAVPELASLLDHMERKSPILIISSTDASMDSVLPFQLPSEYGCVVLGFFDVKSVECESENPLPTPSIQPGKLTWKIQLRYAPPSDAANSDGNLAPPWWLPLQATPVTSDAMVPSPSVPVSESEAGIVEGETNGSGEAPASIDTRWCIVQALDGNPRRSWWHCSGCGRINQRGMLVHRRCPSCQRNEAPAPPFIIEDVLQDTSTAPYPSNHAPQNMKADDISVKEFPDMTSVYCYSFRDGPLPIESRPAEKVACIKHIFTGPYEDLKDQATSLFLQIQEGIELGWQNVTTGVAEGLYYSWASPRHGWVDKEIPQCIHQVRKLISKFVSNYGDRDPGDASYSNEMLCEELPADSQPSTSSHDGQTEDEKVAENVRINHIVALAWTASGSRRGTFVSAKDNPLFMLCLGANVELELERCSPDPLESTTAVNAEASQEVVTPGTTDDGTGEKTKGRKPRKSKNPGPEPGPETNTDPKGKRKGKGKGKERAVVPQPPKEKPKPKPKPTAPPHERLKISMVHGDVLILSGGDYIYTLTRTGMSILLFALPDAQY